MANPFIKLLLKYRGLTIFQEGSPGRARMLNNRFVKRVLINAKNFFGGGPGCVFLFFTL